jgi:DNA polymerase
MFKASAIDWWDFETYRLHLDEDEARQIVNAWREANPWARKFGDALWEAALGAWNTPGLLTTAGRIAFFYDAAYLGGALFMGLPSGRWLTYPQLAWREVEVKDKKTGKPTGEKRTELSFRRARGRAKLWVGTLAENATQAVAADCLRQTVKRIETNPKLHWMKIRMTTHDEIVCEVDRARAQEAKTVLHQEMLRLPAWAEGLPLQAEQSTCFYYTKTKAAQQ